MAPWSRVQPAHRITTVSTSGSYLLRHGWTTSSELAVRGRVPIHGPCTAEWRAADDDRSNTGQRPRPLLAYN
jgi:hypothetical protein